MQQLTVDAVKVLVFKKLLDCYNNQDLLSAYTIIQTDLRKFLHTADPNTSEAKLVKQLTDAVDDEDYDNLVVIMETINNELE